MNVYVGRRRQRGHGIGSILASVFKPLVGGLIGGVKTLAPKIISSIAPKVAQVGSQLVGSGISKGIEYLGKKTGLIPKSTLQQVQPQPMPVKTPAKRKKKTPKTITRAKKKKGSGSDIFGNY